MSGYLCPVDMKNCPDDMCRGSGCMQMQGADLYRYCDGCKQPISDDDDWACECEPDYYDEPEDEARHG